jgi:Uma2 family endonuclease
MLELIDSKVQLYPGQHLTLDEFVRLPANGYKYELIEGVLSMTPAGLQHEEIGGDLYYAIRKYLDQHPIGRLYPSSAGYRLDDQTVLSPDVSFVRTEQLPAGRSPKGYGNFAPDLAVEIISPTDRLSDVAEKVELYFAHGTRLVWALDPVRRRATVYHPDDTARLLRPDEALDGEDVLPGFTCRLSDIL